MQKDNKIRKALVIVNPKAGKIRVRSQVLDLTKLSSSGVAPTMYVTTARGDAVKFAAEMADDYDMLIVRGGDGTFNEAVNGLMKAGIKKPIGYIPSGTTNDLAKALGIPNNTRQAMDIIIGGSEEPHDIGFFNEERYYTYIACFGAFTSASYRTPQEKKNSMGHLAYMLEAVNCIKEIKPIHTKVIIDDDEVIEDDLVYGAVSNSTSVAGVMKLDMNVVDFSDGCFEVMLAKNPGNFVRWKNALWAAKTVNYSKSDCIIFKQCRKIEFFFDNDIPWTTDGEYINGGRHVAIEVKKHAINIYR